MNVENNGATTSIHQFTVRDLEGKERSLAEYKGKVVLIVNTASKCGFTPQLEDMQELYEEFRGEGFELLAFPSNDFAGQEPLEGEAIRQFCQLNYQAEYPICEKVHVRGKNAAPLFQFLADKKQNGRKSATPRWNFHKFLIDPEGQLVDSYLSLTKPTSRTIRKAIRSLLDRNQ